MMLLNKKRLLVQQCSSSPASRRVGRKCAGSNMPGTPSQALQGGYSVIVNMAPA